MITYHFNAIIANLSDGLDGSKSRKSRVQILQNTEPRVRIRGMWLNGTASIKEHQGRVKFEWLSFFVRQKASTSQAQYRR
jgi:hypothetical protein